MPSAVSVKINQRTFKDKTTFRAEIKMSDDSATAKGGFETMADAAVWVHAQLTGEQTV